MNSISQHTIHQMNELGRQQKPFVFIIDFDQKEPLIFDPDQTEKLLWKTPELSNFEPVKIKKNLEKWTLQPVDFEQYQQAFNQVQRHIHNGDTYLLNLTMPTRVETNLTPEEIFHLSQSPYKIWLKDRFVCFSPEIFIRIADGTISSFPMKGTIDASIKNAERVLTENKKEVAEHHTIVDLIRNDLSRIASEVRVDRFMYLDKLTTNKGNLLQMSSQISGRLPADYPQTIGTILAALLPAGSISGAPKQKTLEIIHKTELYRRGYYTGVFGVFDGKNLDSCVLIRFLEQENNELIYKSGGGITFLSNCEDEYHELIRKVYAPID